MGINNELTKALLEHSEDNCLHSTYEKELTFYSAVQSGDVETVLSCMSPLSSKGLGKLSTNPLRNLQYHLIISISLITRFCIEGGLEQEIAYSLSDLFIQKTDRCVTQEEVTNLHKTVILEYTHRMARLPKNQAKSQPIVRCLDYIYKHIHAPLTLEELSNYVGLNPSYLSNLFKKEMGTTLTEFIQSKKIEGTMNMLKFSEISYTDIGNYFGYSSHSHFIHNFRKYTGMTPKQYRNQYFASNWKESKKSK